MDKRWLTVMHNLPRWLRDGMLYLLAGHGMKCRGWISPCMSMSGTSFPHSLDELPNRHLFVPSEEVMSDSTNEGRNGAVCRAGEVES
jgi:hypothetical protein